MTFAEDEGTCRMEYPALLVPPADVVYRHVFHNMNPLWIDGTGSGYGFYRTHCPTEYFS